MWDFFCVKSSAKRGIQNDLRVSFHLPCCANAPNCTTHSSAMRKYPGNTDPNALQSMLAQEMQQAGVSPQVPLRVCESGANCTYSPEVIREKRCAPLTGDCGVTVWRAQMREEEKAVCSCRWVLCGLCSNIMSVQINKWSVIRAEILSAASPTLLTRIRA